jgi:hypothetical protein
MIYSLASDEIDSRTTRNKTPGVIGEEAVA